MEFNDGRIVYHGCNQNSAKFWMHVDNSVEISGKWISTRRFCPDDTDREVRDLIGRTKKIVEEGDGVVFYD